MNNIGIIVLFLRCIKRHNRRNPRHYLLEEADWQLLKINVGKKCNKKINDITVIHEGFIITRIFYMDIFEILFYN